MVHTQESTLDTYALSARYYDAAYAAIDLVDAPFYLELAQQIGGPVLEMGCGTGRVLLPIARAGIEIHGLDQSPAMLDILKEKLQREPEEVHRRVTLHPGDMRSARLNQQFPIVIIPFRPLQHMHAIEDQIAALRTAAAHLNDDGRFAFDVFYPRFDAPRSAIGEERLEMEWPVDGKPGTIIRRFYRNESIDKTHQNFRGTFIYRTFEGDRLVREETAPLHMTWYTYPQLRALFLLADLEVVEEYGSFATGPLDNSATEMIFVLKKSKRSIAR
ncbi:MAG TPA: class I SAM-dependent methyltransferase [Candidatus Acidoferrum sp.]|nr:class I SAM-dependent methyltransferase [Candidatus Acidoferrum sp.]